VAFQFADAVSCVILVPGGDPSQGQAAAGALTIQSVNFDLGTGLISVV
jgi:hypothetical protein